jgi:hypothetical protein
MPSRAQVLSSISPARDWAWGGGLASGFHAGRVLSPSARVRVRQRAYDDRVKAEVSRPPHVTDVAQPHVAHAERLGWQPRTEHLGFVQADVADDRGRCAHRHRLLKARLVHHPHLCMLTPPHLCMHALLTTYYSKGGGTTATCTCVSPSARDRGGARTPAVPASRRRQPGRAAG